VRVLAFDTATSAGVCVGDAGSAPKAWSVSLGHGAWPDRYARLLTLTSDLLATHKPDVVVVETYVGGPKANPNLVGLVAIVQAEARRQGFPVESYYPATVRKHFLGGVKGLGPIKHQVVRRCKMLGWHVGDTDAADAAALWDLTCAMHSRAHQITSIGGLFTQKDGK
jgi:Holliday junction resolvasome RuvABC endonuclease subunit